MNGNQHELKQNLHNESEPRRNRRAKPNGKDRRMSRLVPILAALVLLLALVSVAHAQSTTPTVSTVAVHLRSKH